MKIMNDQTKEKLDPQVRRKTVSCKTVGPRLITVINTYAPNIILKNRNIHTYIHTKEVVGRLVECIWREMLQTMSWAF